MPRYVARGHVRITGGQLTQPITAPNGRKAAQIGQDWARENDLVYDGIETEAEAAARDAVNSDSSRAAS